MKGIRFYADYGDKQAKRLGNAAPNAVAVYLHTEHNGAIECAAALTHSANSLVCSTSASFGYLREACKRVSEDEAYHIHPRLREYLKTFPAG
jgi:hypothetical protein